MRKKWMACLLCVVLLFSVAVSAETTTDGTTTQEEMPFTQGQRPGRGGGMQPPEGFEPPQMQEGTERPQRPEMTVPQETENMQTPSEQPQEETSTSEQEILPQQGGMMQRPNESTEALQSETTDAAQTEETPVDYLTLGGSLLLLAAAFIFVIFYRRKQY